MQLKVSSSIVLVVITFENTLVLKVAAVGPALLQ